MCKLCNFTYENSIFIDTHTINPSSKHKFLVVAALLHPIGYRNTTVNHIASLPQKSRLIFYIYNLVISFTSSNTCSHCSFFMISNRNQIHTFICICRFPLLDKFIQQTARIKTSSLSHSHR